MRAVIQRVSSASVTIDGTVKSSISHGLLILLGIGREDGPEDTDWLVRKIAGLRIFNDAAGVMNRSVAEVEGEALVVSQFTLMASTKKETGRRMWARRGMRQPFRCTNNSARPCRPPSAAGWKRENSGPI